MKHSHAYFANKDCAYFPCHKGADPDFFNCLFCFCPLYFLPDCGGDHVVVKGVKDCSDCLKPHQPGGYERIIGILKERAQAMRDSASSCRILK